MGNSKQKARTKLDKMNSEIRRLNEQLEALKEERESEIARLNAERDALNEDIRLGQEKKFSLGETITSLTALKHELENSLTTRAAQLREGAAFMTTLAEQATFIENAAKAKEVSDGGHVIL